MRIPGLRCWLWPDPSGRKTPNGFLFVDPELPPLPRSLNDHAFWLWRGEIYEHMTRHPCAGCGLPWRCWMRRVGARAIELVLQTSASEILLISYDGGLNASSQHHFYTTDRLGHDTTTDDARVNATCWAHLAQKAAALGVTITNRSPETAITAFARA